MTDAIDRPCARCGKTNHREAECLSHALSAFERARGSVQSALESFAESLAYAPPENRALHFGLCMENIGGALEPLFTERDLLMQLSAAARDVDVWPESKEAKRRLHEAIQKLDAWRVAQEQSE
jgi:hypothetical protein